MNKAIMSTVCILLSGCAMFTGTTNAGYEEGRIVAVAYLVTEDVQTPEIHAAAVLGYKILSEVYGESNDPSLLATIVQSKLAEQADVTPLQSQIVQGMFTMAQRRIESVISEKADRAVVLKNFVRGMKEALEDYQMPESSQ